MFLKKIKLENFKGFDDFELSFLTSDGKVRKQTLLLGQNGTGKSNILKAIAMVTAGSEALLDMLATPTDWVKYGKETAMVSAIISTQKNEDREISIQLTNGKSRNELLKINEESLRSLDEALAHTLRNYFVAGYGASRRFSSNSEEYLSANDNFKYSKRLASVSTLFNPNARLNPLAGWAINLDYKSDGKDLDIIKNTLNYFLEGYTFHSIDKEHRTLLFKEGSNLLKFESLSDGYQNMATWIGDLLYRLSEVFYDLKNPLQARGLLLIDEIDLHLHPKWQRKLLDFIGAKLPNMQLVATTHSPLTAQQANEGELYALQKEKNKVSLVPFVGIPKNLLINQMLMSPIFGLSSDESFEVEQKKNTYRKLKEKNNLSETEKLNLSKLTNEITDLPIQRTNSLLSEEDKALLNDIKQAVSNQ